MNPNFIPLESIHIATPCHADWNKMRGVESASDQRARHCQSCDKNVYNLSAMTRIEAQRLILEHEGHLCVQLHRRKDGTVITSDCPVGISPARKSAKWFQTALGAGVAAILAVFGVRSSWASKPEVQVTAGAPMVLSGAIAPPPERGEIPPTLGRMVMGKPVAPPTAPTKNHANRTPRKSRPNRASHRRHR